jgi:hypothetical protein
VIWGYYAILLFRKLWKVTAMLWLQRDGPPNTALLCGFACCAAAHGVLLLDVARRLVVC